MRLRLIGLFLLAYFAVVAATQAAVPTPIIKIDAATLTAGPVASITNAGSQGGTFNALGQQTPVVETVAGKKAITFNGANGYKASFTAPASVTGQKPWSVSTWIYNPTVSSDSDVYFMWARRASSGGPSATTNEVDGRTASMVYNTGGTWGATDHYGAFAMAWGRLGGAPAAATWHNITITYDGANSLINGTSVGTGTEKIYVDGVLISVDVGKPFDLFPDSNVLVALEERSIYAANSVQTPNQQLYTGLTGSIASLQMWDSELTADNALELAGGTAFLNTGTVTYPLMNNSFENYTFGGESTNNIDQINGTGSNYWTGYAYQGTPTGGTGNQYLKFAHAGYVANNTNQWNNGANIDGFAVLAMEATAPHKVCINQALFGITPNTDYKIWGYFNARKVNDNYAQLELKMDGVDLLSPSPMRIDAVEAAASHSVTFTRVEANWKSNSSPSHYLTIGQIGAAKWNSLNCDKICIAKVGGPANPFLANREVPNLTSLDFYGVQSGQAGVKTFTLFNDGGTDMKIKGLATIGDDAYNYTASASSDTVAAYGGTVDITVTFAPVAVGVYNNAKLKIMTDSTATPDVYLPLTGFSRTQVGNGSFEVVKIATGGGDWQGSYPAWSSNGFQPVTNTNLVTAFTYNGQWKLDNGNLSDGSQGAEIVNNQKNDSANTLSQTIPGFIKGHNYHFRFFANSFKGTTSLDGKVMTDFKVNGASAKGVSKTPTGASTATPVDFPSEITNLESAGTRTKVYDKYEFDWLAPDNGAYPIEFSAIGNAAGDGQNALLLDNVSVWDMDAPGPATVNTTKLDFGNKAINTTSTANVTVYNAGGKDLKVTTVTISGGQVAQFAKNTGLPMTVGKYNGSANFSVKYLNTSYGQKDSTLTLMCDSGEKFVVALTANTSLAAYAPMLGNGSLENGTLNKPADPNKNNTPSNWAWASGSSNNSGRSWSGALYNNNGIDPDGGGAAWIYKAAADTTTRYLYQDVAGVIPGRNYKISLYANATAPSTANPALTVSGTAQLIVSVSKTDNSNSVDVVTQTINKAENAGSFTKNWQLVTANFVAPTWVVNNTVRLAIKLGVTTTEDSLLFDGVKLQEVGPSVQASPASVRFSTVNWYKNDAAPTAAVTISNGGLTDLTLSGGATGSTGFAVVDTQFYNAPQYSIVSVAPAGKTTLAPGETVTVTVKFNPTKKGNYTASALLRVTSNDPNLPTLDIPLLGDAVPVEMSTFSAE